MYNVFRSHKIGKIHTVQAVTQRCPGYCSAWPLHVWLLFFKEGLKCRIKRKKTKFWLYDVLDSIKVWLYDVPDSVKVWLRSARKALSLKIQNLIDVNEEISFLRNLCIQSQFFRQTTTFCFHHPKCLLL